MNKHTAIDPIAELRAMHAVPFERARAIPKSAYTSKAFLDAEVENIFKKEWYCVGRVDTLKNTGDYLTVDLAGQPIVVVRGSDGIVRALANVCRHRMSTIAHGAGNKKALVCPYHAWTYSLDGKMRGAPAMRQNADFDRKDYCLPEYRCEEWLGWVMVSLSPDATPVAEHLSEVAEIIEDYDMEGYSELFKETVVWDTNWKCLAENFMESYHVPVCHAATVGGVSEVDGADELELPLGRKTFNYHFNYKDEDFKLAIAHPDNTRLKGERRRTTVLLTIYPGMMVSLTPGYYWYLSLHPEGPGKVRIIHGGGMSRDFSDDPEAEDLFRQAHEVIAAVQVEDQGCTEKVYRGVCSDAAAPGHLSHLERPIYDFAGYLVERIAH